MCHNYVIIGAIYTTAKTGPALSSAQAGSRLVHFHLQSGPDFSISLFCSYCVIFLLLYFQTTVLCFKWQHPLSATVLLDHSSVFQMADDVQWNASCTRPYSRAELSAVYIICFGTVKDEHTVSCAKPGNFCSCKEPHFLHSQQDSLLVSAGLMIKRLRVRVPARVVGEFSSPESTLCADSHSVSVLPPCYCSGT